MSYKISTSNYGSANTVRWFATKADAKRYALAQVANGYTPHIELVAEDYKSSKTVHFPSVAVKMYFSGMNF